VQTNKFSQHYEIPDEKLSYSELKDRIRKEVAGALPKKERIMLLAKKLEQDLAIKDTICSQICTDFKDLISPDYIRKCLPEEYKQKSKMRRRACNTNIANDDKNVAEQRTVVIDASTGQGTVSEIESEPKEEIIIKLRKQLEEKDKQIATLQASQNVQDIPQLVDDKIGPIKVQNLSRISEYDRRGLHVFAHRQGEKIRRRLTGEGHAAIKLYVMAKDGTTNIKCVVPVVFTVNMIDRTTEMALDESRLYKGLMYI
jgi:hypothetical protein